VHKLDKKKCLYAIDARCKHEDPAYIFVCLRFSAKSQRNNKPLTLAFGTDGYHAHEFRVFSKHICCVIND